MVKKLLFCFAFLFLLPLMSNTISASDFTSAFTSAREGYEINAQITIHNLTITSFSKNWDEASLYGVYEELTNNFYSDEFDYLSNIYLYPDSPEGVLGNYIEDTELMDNGKMSLGGNAYIELFNMDKRYSVKDIAPVLAHEYGHHYTIFNMIHYEHKYYSNWKNSEYAKIRGLVDYPVVYGYLNDESYSYIWDVTEIAANDYVQLLGSQNAKSSFDYMDSQEALENESEGYSYKPISYNLRPQDNLNLPLAADVDGLFSYMLAIGGYTFDAPRLEQNPQIKEIVAEDSFLNKKYTIKWNEAIAEEPLEYTVVMFPSDYPFMIEPLKTVQSGEKMEAVFGTVVKQGQGTEMNAILDYYAGSYTFLVFAQNADGYIFASAPFVYDFGHDFFDANQYLDKKYSAVAIKDTMAQEQKTEAVVQAVSEAVLETEKTAVALEKKTVIAAAVHAEQKIQKNENSQKPVNDNQIACEPEKYRYKYTATATPVPYSKKIVVVQGNYVSPGMKPPRLDYKYKSA